MSTLILLVAALLVGLIAFGAGPGGAPRMRVFNGAKLLAAGAFGSLDQIAATAQVANFFAGDINSRGGIRIGF
jgi:hypothetical protein